jgi:hypothetical protein
MERGGYVTDWGHVGKAVASTAAAGAVFGAVYGVARGRGGQGALLAALQVAGFSTSFFVLREGFRHTARVEDWRQDWVALNALSCASGSALVGSMQRSWSGAVFSRFFVGGAVAGVLGSLAYLWIDEAVRRMRRRESASAPEWSWLPSWAPIHKVTPEELKELQIKQQQQQKR